LILCIDKELEKEMRAYPGVDWAAVAIESLRKRISGMEICRFYNTIVERAIAEDVRRSAKSSEKSPKPLSSPHRRVQRRPRERAKSSERKSPFDISFKA
jgi:hypothetical protein